MTLFGFQNPALTRVSAGTDAAADAATHPGAAAAARAGRARPAGAATATMTVAGTVHKTTVLFAVLFASSACTWRLGDAYPATVWPLVGAGAIGALAVGLATTFKPAWAGRSAPWYAALEGVVLGGFSLAAEQVLPGVVLQATVATVAVLGAMLLAYDLGLIRATANFTRGVVIATMAIALTYVLDLVLAVAGVPVSLLHAGGALGMVVSLVVIAVAAFNLILDFALIEQGARNGAVKQFEWFAAFGLVVSLVWLYIEILHFLLELAGDDD